MSDRPIRIGHADQDPAPDATCRCCEGTTLSTLQPVKNRPGLSAIDYRAGDHGRFKASMLARLASSAYPALRGLGTRDDDDFSIALIDGWATVCDVLSFYQERHANEAFIQTALEHLSITEIACLIGYRLNPGSAAEADLILTMEDPPGAEPDVAELTIPAGTRVQSQPGPDEEPQTFETLEDLEARVEWNRMKARRNLRVTLAQGATGTWLKGQAIGLNPGDAVLVVHPQRGVPGTPGFSTSSTLWAFRRLTKVEPDADLDRTWVEWETPLGVVSPDGDTEPVHRFYALRKQASLFGYNAPHPLVLTERTRDAFGYSAGTKPAGSPSPITGTDADSGDWDFAVTVNDGEILLDAVHKEFVKHSWAVLTLPGRSAHLYKAASADTDSTAKYAMSGKATRIVPDRTGWKETFAASYRRVSVFGGSEELELADSPVHFPVFGKQIELDSNVTGLTEDRVLYVSGRLAQLLVAVPYMDVLPIGSTKSRYALGERLTVVLPPVPLPAWFLPAWQPLGLFVFQDLEGRFSITIAPAWFFKAVASSEDAPTFTERAVLDELKAAAPPQNARLVLKSALKAVYDRATMVVHGNVAHASHGETVTEILGGGNPAKPFQSFELKQNPVTHLVAATENGVESTLTLRIDGVKWEEKPDLYQRGATSRVFTTTLDDEGVTTVRFGDGISGARPHAGRDNIQAEYRKGLGAAGNVRAGQLSLALDRPLGLKEVTNPLAANGGSDAETSKAARRNAPIYTLTLGRVVSVTDYRDFALGYPGIARADARWIWRGQSRRIVVTVAGDDGKAVTKGGMLHNALLAAYRKYGDPLVMFDLLSFQPRTFRLGLRVAVDAAYDDEQVLEDVETALREAYSFDNRDFAQPVALSNVAAKAHAVKGVVAVDIDKLYRSGAPASEQTDNMLLQSLTGRTDDYGNLLAAEILTLHSGPFDKLEVMT